MYIRDIMTRDPISIEKNITISQALSLMKENNFRRLPVVDDQRKIIGLVTEGQIQDSPQITATSLSVYELNYILSKTEVKDIMIKDVVTIGEGAFLEEAAKKLKDSKVGSLPIVDENDRLVGMVTDNDIFKALTNLLGYEVQGSKYLISLDSDEVGQVAKITKIFADSRVNLATVATYYGDETIEISIIAHGKDYQMVSEKLEEAGFRVKYSGPHN